MQKRNKIKSKFEEYQKKHKKIMEEKKKLDEKEKEIQDNYLKYIKENLYRNQDSIWKNIKDYLTPWR